MKTCDSVQSALNAWADGEHRRSGQPLLATLHHLLSCSNCRRTLPSLRSQRASLRALPAPAPPSHLRAAVLEAVTGKPAPVQGVSKPRRKRAFWVLAPIAGAAAVALLVLGPWSQRELGAEDVARAMGRVNSWRFKGWKLIQGKRVPWEITGRKQPFFYREKLGDSLVIDDGQTRIQIIPPATQWKAKGLLLRTPSRPGDENVGWTYDAMFKSWQSRPRSHSETADQIVFKFSSTGMEGYGSTSDDLYTVDKRTSLPTQYEVLLNAKGSSTEAESLAMEFDPRDFQADAKFDPPKGFLVVDSRARPSIAPDRRSVLDSHNGLTAQATPLAMDRDGILLVRLRGWLGNVPLGKHWELSWKAGSSGLDIAGTDESWQVRDERGRLFVEAQFHSRALATGNGTDQLMVFTPLEPLPKGAPLPGKLRLGLRATAVTMQLASGANLMEEKRLMQEEMSWILPLPSPTSTARVVEPLHLEEALKIKGVERETMLSATSRGRAWYYGRVHNSKDHSPQAENKRRRSLYWDHRYVAAMDETSTAALLQRLWMARDYRWLGEPEKGVALAKEVIAISDRHPKIWSYYRKEAEAFLKEVQPSK